MKAEYRREVDRNYLILEAENPDTASYPVRILAGNVVPVLLKCRMQSMDGKCLIYYDITSRQSVAELYEKKMYEAKDIRALFGGILHALEEMGEYLLDPARLLLRPEFIYADAERKEFVFCCLPGYEQDVREQLCALIEYLLPKLDHEDKTAVMLGYGIYRRVMEETFRLENLKEELYVPAEAAEQEAPQASAEDLWKQGLPDAQTAGEQQEKREEEEYRPEKMPETVWEREPGRGKSERETVRGRIVICVLWAAALLGVLAAGFLGILPWLSVDILLGLLIMGMGVGMLADVLWKRLRPKKSAPLRSLSEELGWRGSPEESVRPPEPWLPEHPAQTEAAEETTNPEPENYEETVILSRAGATGPASFVSREPGELATIYLREDITVIGKLSTAADAVIPLPTVSRLHAKVRKREAGYYLSDLNSRNGTAVNGRLLQGNEEYELQDEDEVDFAQARYVFLK